MKIVLEEAKNFGGYAEGDDTLYARIKSEYFAIKNVFTTKNRDPSKISWYAVFACWCLQKAGYANPSTCRALKFNPDYKHDGPNKPYRASGMRRISKPCYGCIVVWKNTKGGGMPLKLIKTSIIVFFHFLMTLILMQNLRKPITITFPILKKSMRIQDLAVLVKQNNQKYSI